MDVDGIDAAKGPSDWLGYWRPWCVKKGKECVMVGWSCREAGDRYRRVASGGNEKVEGVAAVMCWEVDVVDKVEIRQKRKELSCLRVRRFITGDVEVAGDDKVGTGV